MNIGIDFDNTIARYDTSFREVAMEEGIIDGNWQGKGKTELRDHLRCQPNGEKTWMKLQGRVYGKYMHRAEILPGVANFFMSCKRKNHNLFIVSHKTEYGHFDSEKVSLRSEALKWMEKKCFFDPEVYGIKKEEVFFADTRGKKVKKIAQLKCDWFIDDLPEVFEESHFPSDTKKILFGSKKQESFNNVTVLESWRKISEKILGETADDDIIAWSKRLVDKPINCIEKKPGGGNSSIYKVLVSDKRSYVLKYYPDQISDKRPRLKTEFTALCLLQQHNIINVPKVVEKNDDLNLGLYEWIKGENIDIPSIDDLDQAIGFVEQLYTLSQKIDKIQIEIASEACLSANALVSQIEKRLLRLRQESKHFQELSIFLDATFEPLWAKVKKESISLWPLETQHNNLSQEKQTLSPSDFGFHNCLKLDDGKLSFLDFDYFGWDDPVKLTADFIWHPAMNLNTELKEKWQKAMLELFSNDPQFESRLNAAIPLYGLRWAMIVLNEFLPGYTDRRQKACESDSYDPLKSQIIQLDKAKQICSKVKAMGSLAAFAK